MNNITEVKSALTGDKYYKIDHNSGLTIYLYPKKDYNSKYAIFGTRFGSVNNAFSLDGGEVKRVPDGIAHYLEHKMFECEDGDAFLKYAKTGANANALASVLYRGDSREGAGHYRSGNPYVRRFRRVARYVQYARKYVPQPPRSARYRGNG